MNQNLILARNFLFKWFIVGFILLLISVIIFIFLKDLGAEVAYRLYNVDNGNYYNIVLLIFGLTKSALFFFVLSPAIALHWMIKRAAQ